MMSIGVLFGALNEIAQRPNVLDAQRPLRERMVARWHDLTVTV